MQPRVFNDPHTLGRTSPPIHRNLRKITDALGESAWKPSRISEFAREEKRQWAVRTAHIAFASVLLAVFFAVANYSEAASFTVNKRTDPEDRNPGNGKCDAKAREGLQCTLRAAIQEANALTGGDTVKFDLGGASEVTTISPGTALPEITQRLKIQGYSQPGASPNTLFSGDDAVLRIELDGSLAPGATGLKVTAGDSVVRGLVVNDFAVGIELRSGDENRVLGNFIGTDAEGTGGEGNATNIRISESLGNQIGGLSPADRNLVSDAFSTGIELSDGSDNVIHGNYIGTDRTGAGDLGNATYGILMGGSSVNNGVGGVEPGAGNVIAFTSGYGVNVRDGLCFNNQILSNSIHDNGVMGINIDAEGVTVNDTDDPDSGANLGQNHPLITDADEVLPGGTNIDGTLNSKPSTTFRIQFFSNPVDETVDEGKRFIGETLATTDAGGDVTFSTTVPAAGLNGQYVTATATDSGGNTSEFSPARIVDPAPVGG